MSADGDPAPSPRGDASIPPLPPHRDPARFDTVVASVVPEGILVVLERAMGPQLRAVCTAEDVWQETLALAWRDREQHTWEGPRAWRAWVLAIGRNRIRDLAREIAAEKRGGRAPALFSAFEGAGGGSDAGTGRGLADLLPAGSSTPSRIAGHREAAAKMQEALATLPDEVREIVALHLFEDVPMAEIATRLGVGADAVSYRFRKGAALYAQRLRSLRGSTSEDGPVGRR